MGHGKQSSFYRRTKKEIKNSIKKNKRLQNRSLLFFFRGIVMYLILIVEGSSNLTFGNFNEIIAIIKFPDFL